MMLPRQLFLRRHQQWQRGSSPFLFARNYAAFSSTSASASATDTPVTQKTPVCWLDLRGSGLSVLERLLLEECLMQTDVDRNWAIAGYHETALHRYLDPASAIPAYHPKKQISLRDDYLDGDANESVVIVMGLGGKVEHVLDAAKVRQDGVLTLKRFSGGGTVVLDHDSIWTTLIGRPQHQPVGVPMFPRQLMEYSAEIVFGPLFDRLLHLQQTESSAAAQKQKDNDNAKPSRQAGRKPTLVMDTKSCGASENSGRVVTIPDPSYQKGKREGNGEEPLQSPTTTCDASSTTTTRTKSFFHLRENDYCMGERKMGGNAQSIGKYGWLHHTSFLWDYQDEHMGDYLTLPVKRPAYRQDRSHDDFLVKLCHVYPNLTKADFCQQLGWVCEQQFAVEPMTLQQAMAIVNHHTNGRGLQGWWDTKSRTRILQEL